MEIETILLIALACAYGGEKLYNLYKRVMADGKITLDEIKEIAEEVEEVIEDIKEKVD